MKKIIVLFLQFIFAIAVYAQKPVIFMVKDRTGANTTKIKFMKSSKIFEPEVLLDEQVSTIKVLSDSTYKITISEVSEPSPLTRNLSNFGWGTVFAQPGDSLHIVIEKPIDEKKQPVIKYIGKNAANYNIGHLLDMIDKKVVFTDTPKTYTELTQQLDKITKHNKETINSYLLSNHALLADVLHGLNSIKTANEIYYGLEKFKIKLSESDYSHFIKTYLPSVAKEKNSLLLSTNQYVYSLKQVLAIINEHENPSNNFTKKMELIRSYFSGLSADLLLANSYYRFTTNNADKEGLALSNNWYQANKGKLKDDAYNHFIEIGYARVNKINKPWPAEVLNVNFYDSHNKSIKLRDILAKHKGKTLVLDHWATWCGPCIDEFEVGKAVVKELEEKGIEFIYLSIDVKSAEKKMNELVKTYQLDSYRLDEKGAQIYKNYISLNYVPRYLLINEKGLLSNTNLPRPSSNFNFKQMLNNSLQNTK